MSLFIDMPVTADTLVIGTSISARWSPAINRAAELLRERHPKADDAEILRMMLLHGVVAVIDGANNERYPRNEDDDTIVAIAEAVL